MLEMGKMNPERMKEGNIVKTMASIKANCWDLVPMEMKSPIPNPQVRNNPETTKRKNMFPLRGTLNKRIPIKTTKVIWISPKKK